MKIRLRFSLLFILLLTGLTANAFPVQAHLLYTTPTAYDLIAAVNALRASKGLMSFQINGALMSAAQGQSDYQASIGTWSHSGTGGSRAIDRATSAGYGGGAKVFILENVAVMSPAATLQTLIYTIWADSIHWNTMTNSQFTDCGAGVTEKDGQVYYTLVAGYVAGSPGSSSTSLATTTALGTVVTPKPGAPTPTTDVIKAVQTTTPLTDGSVVHVVQPGQALWAIAIAYNVKIVDIQTLNNMAASNNTVRVGQKLLICAASTPTVSPTASNTPPPPTRTLKPTNTQGLPTLTFTPGPSITPTSHPLLPQTSSFQSNPRQSLGIILVVVCGLGLVAVLVSNFLKKK